MSDISSGKQLMLKQVLEGLQNPQKSLPSKYFYDKRGSELFEQITKLDEYYPTETELKILKDNIEDISACVGEDSKLIELGSGSSEKTRLLLDNLIKLKTYIPVDISEDFLRDIVQNLNIDYPGLTIKPVYADYTQPSKHPEINDIDGRTVFFYPGSTIGNFYPEEAQHFLSRIADSITEEGGLLIGVDLKKNKKVLEAAYNDKEGVTAAFNKNILNHINHVLDADFDLSEFEHKAFYNEEKGRVEMHLISKSDQVVQIVGNEISFKKGEGIHTESSYKYSINSFRNLVNDWFDPVKCWTDKKNYFSVHYLKAKLN